jgi:coenzyme F420-reducing hydrogenase delta subunit
VVTQGSNVNVQANKALETRVQTLTKEKQELEILVTRIRAESAQNSKQMQMRMNEMKAELEKLNSVKAGIPQQNQPPEFRTML